MTPTLPAENLFLDLSDRTKLRLTGGDRVRFLNGQVSNDMRQVTTDEAVYTGVMTIKGKLCADAFVHVEGETLLVDADSELRESLAARLEKYIIADDVQVEDVTDELGLFHLLDFHDEPGKAAVPTLPNALAEIGPGVRGVRATRLGRPGLDVFFDADLGNTMRAQMHHARYTLLNEDAAESMRILLGVPRWGAELDEAVLPAEAGIEDRAVSFSKGCYIGQEVVSRVRSVGHVNRQLRGFRATDASPIYVGMRLHATDAEGSLGKEVGRITSAAPSAGHGGAAYVALGYVRRESGDTGTILAAVLPPESVTEVDESAFGTGDAPPPPCQVEVCSLPFI